ncbi:MAG TPA: thiolase family protein [bacterium]|nr:thiolase family protein [bacterium]
MDRVAVVGFAQTKYEPEKKGQHLTELVYEAVRAALSHAGIGIKEIDNVVSCSQDFLDGRTISNRTIPEVEGAYLKSESKVESDGTQAVAYGAMRIMSGKHRTTLCLAHCKMSEGAQNVIANAMHDPFYQLHIGLDDVSSAALQARAYLNKHGLSERDMATAAAHSLENAASNPLVHRVICCDEDDVMGSPLLASPIRELMAMPVTDGACALVLAHESVAKKYTDKPVWIAGFGIGTDAYYLGDRGLASLPALEDAAWKAYRMAGIADPAKDIQLIELTDYYAHQSLMSLEAMGFAEPGRGIELFESGGADREGRFPVNPSGGVLGGNPLCVAGMTRVIECVKQIRGENGALQAGRPVTALAQGGWGPAGQSQCVVVLRGE